MIAKNNGSIEVEIGMIKNEQDTVEEGKVVLISA